MAASETSLDLLSQAAELVNTSMAPSITAIKNTSTKDLPTRGKKLIRTRSRRNLPITNTGDNKAEKKNGISPQLSPKKDPSLLSFAYIFPKAPIEDEASYVSQMSSSYPPPPPYTSPNESLRLKTNPVSSYPRESFFKSPPSPPVFVMETSSNENEEDDERPLDMSKKCGGNDTRQQARPSVITCASALYSSKCRHVDQSTCLCSPSQNSPARKLDMDGDNSSDGVVVHRTGHRREISSGMCDPVIDEHFRRSLGKDYSEIFASTTSNSVSVTVDDHFAKALGDTWLRLQQPDKKDCPLAKTSTNLKRTPSLFTL